MRKCLAVPNCTSSVICPRGRDAFLGMIPQNGESLGVRSSFLSPSSSRDPANRMLRALPPSMRTFRKHTSLLMGLRKSRKHPGYGMSDHWSALEKVIGYSDQSRYLGSVMGPSYVATDKTRRATSFYSRLSLKMALPPKIVAMILVAS